MNITARRLQCFQNGTLGAEIQHSHIQIFFLIYCQIRRRCPGSFLHIVRPEGSFFAKLFQLTEIQILGGNDAFDRSFLPDLFRDFSRIHAADPRNIHFFQPLIQRFLTSVVGWRVTHFLHHQPSCVNPIRLIVLCVDPVVSGQRPGHCNHLPHIRWIRQGFLISCHCRIEYQFSDTGLFRTEALPRKQASVLQIDFPFHAFSPFIYHFYA